MSRARQTDRPVILVVDDDHDARWIYSMYLRSRGCRVYTASDGQAAVDKATALSPDLIVLDLAMPKLDGWEAIRLLDRSKLTHDIPVLAISAVPAAEGSALEAGCDAYLSKPCEPTELWIEVQRMLGTTKPSGVYATAERRRSITSP